MKSIAYSVLGCVFFSIMVYADPASKTASTSSLKSRSSEPNITNEAEYAEFVRKREGGTANSHQSVASASSSSKPAATRK